MYNGIIYEALTNISYSSNSSSIKYPNEGYEWSIVTDDALYWINGKGYFKGQKVVYNNIVYIVTADKTLSNPSEGYDWDIEGDYPQYWLSKKGYKQGECVVYDKQIYEALRSNSEKKPSENPQDWKLK